MIQGEKLTIEVKKTVDNIGLILLAAGASKRLGKPKQLLRFRGETLLGRIVKTALASDCRPIIVVLGARAEKLKPEIEEFDVKIFENSDWEKGMGTSIRIAAESLLEDFPETSGAILTVCDQPFVSTELIEQMTENFRSSEALIVACSYNNTLGVPALFRRRLFPELAALESDEGAKKIIYKHLENVVEVPFEAGVFDVDTEQDYLNLIKSDEVSDR